MPDQSLSSKPAIQTSSYDDLRKAAKALIEALDDERFQHGDLVTAKRQRAVNRLRAALAG
jgi:hypothetical protein